MRIYMYRSTAFPGCPALPHSVLFEVVRLHSSGVSSFNADHSHDFIFRHSTYRTKTSISHVLSVSCYATPREHHMSGIGGHKPATINIVATASHMALRLLSLVATLVLL